MTIDIKKKYKTRNGRAVKLLMTDGGAEYPVKGAWEESDGVWTVDAWTADGEAAFSNEEEHDHDLIECKPSVEVDCWLNVFYDGCTIYDNQDKAIKHGQNCRGALLARLHIKRTVEIGEGLSDE